MSPHLQNRQKLHNTRRISTRTSGTKPTIINQKIHKIQPSKNYRTNRKEEQRKTIFENLVEIMRAPLHTHTTSKNKPKNIHKQHIKNTLACYRIKKRASQD